ncbi:NapC/NirT family cytochrome c [Desulfosporosinus sp. Sb-LF]|uniref:cytochrome c3 family protein n=1 Tax=Desulfosporosinus sp. Sb-LF TaxID=2560027 RepID=UPI00107F1A2A|nr:NapC/NirT family cytochrome c [Desulfosporosinus sp. Sb-LF]TGE34444.1 cytochrome C [Desulfosporosinus sp. Sb-LF]
MSIKSFKINKKFLLTILLILVGVVALFWGTFQKTSQTSYCSSCHMMKPEFYTLKASSHSQLECVACHVEPGILTKVKYKLVTVEELFASLTGNYGIAITSTTPIPDATCTQCHDMNTRKVTPSGDLIIPHSKHTQAGVSCTECHTGIAHGNIAEKRATFITDYGKWDESTGKSFMSDLNSIRPNMDVCLNCHKVRKEPLNCSACHTTSMKPSNHNDDAFKNGGHGELAKKDILNCDSCHSYMSKDPVEVSTGNGGAFQKFLAKDSGKTATISASDYAKANTFCKDCHSKKPPSHTENWQETHGAIADQNKDKCFTCHDNTPRGNSPVTTITCASCHPSIHADVPWQQRHPIQLPDKPQVSEFCYTCHSQNTCGKCHSTGGK